MQNEAERQVVIKTTRGRLGDLATRIAALHGTRPELIVLPVAGGGERYLAWVRESVAGG